MSNSSGNLGMTDSLCCLKTPAGVCKASNDFSISPLPPHTHRIYLQEWQTFMLLRLHTRLHSRNTPAWVYILVNTLSVPISVDAIWLLTLYPQWLPQKYGISHFLSCGKYVNSKSNCFCQREYER